jgi:hypothetical protein
VPGYSHGKFIVFSGNYSTNECLQWKGACGDQGHVPIEEFVWEALRVHVSEPAALNGPGGERLLLLGILDDKFAS